MANQIVQGDYKQARDKLVESIRQELLGFSEDEEKITENPVTRYASGMLFPNHYERRRDNVSSDADSLLDSEREPEGANEPEAENPEKGSSNSFYPSVMGLSFYTVGSKNKLQISISWTKYSKLDNEENFIEFESLPEEIISLDEFKKNFRYENKRLYSPTVLSSKMVPEVLEKAKATGIQSMFYKLLNESHGVWKAKKFKKTVQIADDTKSLNIADGIDLIIEKAIFSGSTLITVAIKNSHYAASKGMDEDHVFFNVSLKVSSTNGKNIFSEYKTPPLFKSDVEEQSLALLYRKRKTYAVGHGCAANWDMSSSDFFAKSIFTESIPSYEVAKLDFSIPGANEQILSMLELSGEGGLKDVGIASGLKSFCSLYSDWIATTRTESNTLDSSFKDTAESHLKLCEEARDRMLEGIKILESDAVAFESFKLANKVMLMQSVQSDIQKSALENRAERNEDANWNELGVNKKWRPFQLGFLLLSLKGIIDPESRDRNIVDLIWFPTGGGKTEAYLGLTAFTIFYRRITYKDGHSGTAVVMRYTLRLLTAQQFQRACTMICAIEKLRSDNPDKFGTDEVSIGLWVGMDSTPNTLDQAEESFREFIFGNSNKNPSPLLSCPWCGEPMVKENKFGKREYGYKSKTRPRQANFYCLRKTCHFHERLPVLIVDEEIYRDPPTLLFGTVDKFAQMPFQKGVSSIFASNRDSHNRPPELIIQDELHLISGALGTLVGIYETAIDYLCSLKGVRPKIVASTATVRRAVDQCKNLFNRDMRQFPPPGIEIGDSFFAKELPVENMPGRLYVGILPSGKTQTTASVRLITKLIYAVSILDSEDQVKDKFWTLVAYFNSIRELGGFISLVNDDIPLYANALKQRYGGIMRHISLVRELTSRKKAEEIPQILEELSNEIPEKRSIDVLAATNMISVGVDIDRLGLMVIRGQPKLTSEYIQVSSRIGRKFPGLVVTLYNSAKTRDRAHYERFRTYHESFYRYVEPSSVTPFSLPSRTRALSAVLTTMIRHGSGSGLENEDGASLFNPDSREVKQVVNYILNRVSKIDPSELPETKQEINRLLELWSSYITDHEGKIVYKNNKQGFPLAKNNEKFGKGLWLFPTSMRNVDAECNIDIRAD